jgi:hypothetical protein
LAPKIGPNVDLCHLCGFAARRLHSDLADFVVPVRDVNSLVNPLGSPADVIGVPGAARLRIEAAPLAAKKHRSALSRRHRCRCDDRDRHEIVALPARSRCLHLKSDEVADDLAQARQLRFGEIVAAVLPLTVPCG